MKTCAAALVVFGAFGLTACTSTSRDSSPGDQTATAPASTPTATPDATTTPLAYAPEKSAADNLDYFTSLADAVVVTDPDAGGRAFIDALVGGGFDKAAMQVTADRTTVDLAADSVQFSVAINGECLIGQYGSAIDGLRSVVAPLLGSGTCLVGATRQIDW